MELFANYALYNNKVRMLSLTGNIVFEADLSTDLCRVIGFYEAPITSSYCYACQIGDFFLAAPSAVTDFIVLDRNNKWTRIPVEERKGKIPILPDLKIWTVFGKGHYAWKIGFSYPAILKVNLENGKVEYISNWLQDVEDRLSGTYSSAYFGSGYCIIGETLILPLFCCPGLLEINMNSYEYELHMFDPRYIGFRTISGSEELWIETIQGNVICISRDWKVNAEIDNLDIKKYGPFVGGYWRPVVTDTKVYMFPYYSYGIMEINRNTYEVTVSELNQKVTGKESRVDRTSEVERQGDKLYFFADYGKSHDFFVYDLNNKKMEKHDFHIDESDIRTIVRENMRTSEFVKESEIISLNGFIQEIGNR